MKVLLTCHVRFASAMAWYTFHLARGLIKAGHEVSLSAQRGSPLASWAKSENITGSYEQDFHSGNPLEIAQTARMLRSEIAHFKPDILNPHCPPGHALLAVVRPRVIPLIRTVAEPRPPKRHFINRWLHERFTDGMIFTTASSIPRYQRAFRMEGIVHSVILPGLDTSLFPALPRADMRTRFNIPGDAVFAAIVARMSPEKGQELLIDALALLDDHPRRKIVVLLTGDDSRERSVADLKRLATSKGVLSQLRFAERLTDVRELLNEIDLGVITSVRSEAVCRVALEYMNYGKPIAATKVNILEEVVQTGVNGWSVSATDPADLAAALRAAVTEQSLLKRYGENGRRLLLERYTLEHMVESTLSFYHQIMNRHG